MNWIFSSAGGQPSGMQRASTRDRPSQPAATMTAGVDFRGTADGLNLLENGCGRSRVMDRVLGRAAPAIYVLLRVVAGFLFACHGAQKLFGVLGGHVAPMETQAWVAGIIEMVCGTLIALGLFTSYAAFVASGEM